MTAPDDPTALLGKFVTWDEGRMSGEVVAVSGNGRAFVRTLAANKLESVPVGALELVQVEADDGQMAN